MSKKVIIAAGGTGGHLYPAMETAFKLQEHDPHLKVLFAAGGLASNPFFDRNAFDWRSIFAAPLIKQNPWKVFKNCGQMTRGIWQSCKLISSFKPDLVIGFGSYHSFPILSAAYIQKYPMILHEQNSKPGKVIRLFSNYALMTGIYFPSARNSLKGETTLLTMPLRNGFSRQACTREEACHYFGIDPHKLTLLIFGGSQGARFINQAVAELLCRLKSNIQILHFAGNELQAGQVMELYSRSNLKAIVKPSEKRMDFAWRVADLAIVRAGAGTIAEQIEFEVPAIFIPYPHAADKHQDSNADFVVDFVGGGWKWDENKWEASGFLTQLEWLLENKDSLLLEKRQNLALYKKSASSAQFIAEICKRL